MDSASSTSLQPAWAPLKVHGPPIAQQPSPSELTSMPERPSLRVGDAVVMGLPFRCPIVGVWVALEQSYEPKRLCV